MLDAAKGPRQRRAIFLGICAGLRRAELLGLQGQHFARPGWIWVSSEIAKGGRERWVPVIADLEPIVAEIQEHLSPTDFVLCAQRWRDPGTNTHRADYATRPASEQALWRLVRTVGEQAGIGHPIRPHLLRHAYADHIARFAGVRNAQFLLGHAGLGTTEGYLGKPTLDELSAAVAGFTFGPSAGERAFYPVGAVPANPVEAPTGIEPVLRASRLGIGFSPDFAAKVALYTDHFRGLHA
jgi:integrase